MTRKRTGEPNASNVVCVDIHSEAHKRHRWGGDLSGYCARCAVLRVEWDKTAARRRAGELLVGERGEIVELNGEEN